MTKPSPPESVVVCSGCSKSWKANAPSTCECTTAWMIVLIYLIVLTSITAWYLL
jgi:hypothetical protein